MQCDAQMVDTTIKSISQIKYLGVILHENSTWDGQIKELQSLK